MHDWEKEILNDLVRSATQVENYSNGENDIDETRLLNCMDIEMVMELLKDKHILHDRCEEIDPPVGPSEE